MTFKEYEKAVVKSPIFNERYSMEYLTMSLAGESGEFVEKIKKLYRRDDPHNLTDNDIESLALELGDVMWSLAWLADWLGLELEDIAQMNIDKLDSRIERGKLSGDGDKR